MDNLDIDLSLLLFNNDIDIPSEYKVIGSISLDTSILYHIDIKNYIVFHPNLIPLFSEMNIIGIMQDLFMKKLLAYRLTGKQTFGYQILENSIKEVAHITERYINDDLLNLIKNDLIIKDIHYVEEDLLMFEKVINNFMEYHNINNIYDKIEIEEPHLEDYVYVINDIKKNILILSILVRI